MLLLIDLLIFFIIQAIDKYFYESNSDYELQESDWIKLSKMKKILEVCVFWSLT
jgi:hypothetical protein